MNVSLTRELEQLVTRKVKTGRYQSASEVIREGLRALEERDRMTALHLQELRRDIHKGLTSGKSEPLDIEEIKRETRRRMTRAKK